MSLKKGCGKIKITDLNDGKKIGHFSLDILEGGIHDANGMGEFINSFSDTADNYSKDEIAALLFNQERLDKSMHVKIETGYHNTIAFNSFKQYRGLIECLIDWGDGKIELFSNSPTSMKHQYATSGEYTLKIYGVFNLRTLSKHVSGQYFHQGRITDVLQFGSSTSQLLEAKNLFKNFPKDKFTAIDYPVFYKWTENRDWSGMFYNCPLFNHDLSNWDMKEVTNTSYMFARCPNFNKPFTNKINNLIYSNNMFDGCLKFNQDLSTLDMSKVVTIKSMFTQCTKFNQALSNWNVSNVRDAKETFAGCISFNSSLLNWDTAKFKFSSKMFYNCTVFNQDITKWNVSNIQDMSSMFYKCTVFNQNITQWDVSKMQNAFRMFYKCTAFDQSIGSWDVSKMLNATEMFSRCTAFDQNLSHWRVSNLSKADSMFLGCTKFNQDLSNWDVSNVLSTKQMFTECTTFDKAPTEWNTKNVNDMTGMFYHTNLPTETNFVSWNVNKVTKFKFFTDDSTIIAPLWKI